MIKEITFKKTTYLIGELFFSEDGVTSYKAKDPKGKDFLVSIYEEGAFSYALGNLKKLKKAGIKTPNIIVSDETLLATLQEMPKGDNLLSLLSKGPLEAPVMKDMFRCYQLCRFSKIALSYHPEYFIYDGKDMTYLSFLLFPSIPERAFEGDPIREYFLGVEGLSHLREKGYPMEGVTPLPENVVNKQIVLASISFW